MRQSDKEKEIQRIAEAITHAICTQQIPPGTRLIESQLMVHLNANRNHVRAALQRLALKHLVTIKNNVGASVAEPSVSEAHDIFNARLIVERGIIETLCEKLSSVDLARLKKQLHKETFAIHSENRVEIIQESGNFHLLLAKLCNNAILEEMLKDLIARSSLIISLYQQDDNAKCCCNEHREIIEHIAQKQPEKAIVCMTKHLEHLHLSQNMRMWEGKTVNLQAVFA